MLAECEVLLIGVLESSILEEILSYPVLRLPAILLRVGRVVPGDDRIFTQFNMFYVLDHGESFMLFLQVSRVGSISSWVYNAINDHTHNTQYTH